MRTHNAQQIPILKIPVIKHCWYCFQCNCRLQSICIENKCNCCTTDPEVQKLLAGAMISDI